jgi:diguanylate cyclase (GGDEF)-like protein
VCILLTAAVLLPAGLVQAGTAQQTPSATEPCASTHALTAAKERQEQEIAALRAAGEKAALERMRIQLAQAQRNQQMQMDYLQRHNQLQTALTVLLGACLVLALVLAWALWRSSIARLQQALEDPLTGLHNRRFLLSFMQHETLRMRRNLQSALLLMVDLDHFKKVNDRYGHEVGDQALVSVAEVLRASVRNSDIVARWGGEEFVVICVQSTREHLDVICSRIRQRLQRSEICPPGKPPFVLTVSIGSALYTPGQTGEPWEDALARADRAMYQVKKNGRDGWAHSTPEDERPPAKDQSR